MRRTLLGTALLCLSLAFWSCTPSLGSDSSGGVSGELRGDVTWSADTYVSGDLVVYGKLTINPGVTVTLANDVELVVDGLGGLYALGTADKPIVFKAKDSSEGWDCISFTEAADTNSLVYCDISGAGSDGGYAIAFSSIGSAEAVITNCAIHGNKGGGIDASYADSGTKILSNRFYGNAGFPLSINEKVACDSSNLFHEGSSAAAASTSNCVEFRGDVSADRTVKFDITELPYYLSSGLVDYGSLTIDPGVTLWMGAQARITISGVDSIFQANGESGKAVEFCARIAASTWDCVYIAEGADANSFSYCDFSGADSGSGHYAVYVYSQYGTAISLDHCSFDGNKAGGLDVYWCPVISDITDCTFGDNGDSGGNPPYDLLYKAGLTLGGGNTGSSIISES